jgi:hypothetical protein
MLNLYTMNHYYSGKIKKFIIHLVDIYLISQKNDLSGYKKYSL